MAGQRSRRSSTGNSPARRSAGGAGAGAADPAAVEAKRKRSGGSLTTGGGAKRPPGVTEQVSWMDVQVGDVLEIRNRENIPADLVMLSCSDPKGTCFVMTSNLDGETNLKPRVVSPDLRAAVVAASDAAEGAGGGQGGVLALAAKGAFVECDLPNQKLEHFDGTLEARRYTYWIEYSSFAFDPCRPVCHGEKFRARVRFQPIRHKCGWA